MGCAVSLCLGGDFFEGDFFKGGEEVSLVETAASPVSCLATLRLEGARFFNFTPNGLSDIEIESGNSACGTGKQATPLCEKKPKDLLGARL